MGMFGELFNFLAGGPALIGLIVVSPIIFLAGDWPLSLSALLVQYILAGIALSRFLQPEVVIVKILVGVLVVPILYLVARRIRELKGVEARVRQVRGLRALQAGWAAGPLGLPLRFLAFLLAALAVLRLFQSYRPDVVAGNTALVAGWIAAVGLLGLVLSGEPMRVAPAALSILTAFDLVYAPLEQNLATVGLFGAFTLLAALAFSYLAAVQGLSAQPAQPEDGEEAGS